MANIFSRTIRLLASNILQYQDSPVWTCAILSQHSCLGSQHLIRLLSNSGFANIQERAPWLERPALIHPYQSSRILILCFGFNVILVESSCPPGTPANQLTLSSFVFQYRHASEMLIVQAESQFACFADRGFYDMKSKDSSSCGCRCFPSFYPANCRRESVKRWSFDLEKQGLSTVSVLGQKYHVRSATESWLWWLQFSHKLTPWFKIGCLEEG